MDALRNGKAKVIELTREAWKKFAPGCPANYTEALFSELALLRDAGILDNERRWCHFAATAYEETGDFREIREDLRYTSCKALRDTWPSRFGHKSDAELKHLLKNPVGLADQVYGCYSGRKRDEIGDVGPGEAFAWRGGGWFNTTFKPTVEGYCKKLGIPTPPNALDDPVLTLRFAVLEWTEARCNEWADENDVRKVAKAINTGSANSNVQPVGLDARKKAFARAWGIWGETGKADAGNTHRPLGEIAGKVALPTTVGTVLLGKAAEDPVGATRKAVDKGKEIKSVVEDARGLGAGLVPKSLPLPFVGVGLVIAAVLFIGVVVVRARGSAITTTG